MARVDPFVQVLEPWRYRPSGFIEALWINEKGVEVEPLCDIQRQVADLRFRPDGSGIDNDAPNLYIVNKIRQTGFTKVIFAGRAFHKAIFGHTPASIVMVDSERKAFEFLDLIRKNIANLKNKWGVKIQPARDREDQIEFANGCKIVALSSNPDALRFWSGDILLDEFAFHEKQDDLLKSAVAIAQGTYGSYELIVNSTPNGEGNKYHSLWEDAHKSNSPWQPILVRWQDIPRLAEKIDLIRRSVDSMTFDQEYGNRFINAKTSFFTADLVDAAVRVLPNIPSYSPNPEEGMLWAFVDFGAMSDETSCWIVLRKPDRTKQPIAWKRLKGPYQEQMPILSRYLTNFGIQRLRADNTGVGVAVVPMLEKALRDLQNWLPVERLNFTNEWKAKIITELKAQIEAGATRIPDDAQLKQQLLGLRREILPGGGVRFSHATGYHDDDVWALAGACEDFASDGAFEMELDTEFGVRESPWAGA